MQYKRIGPYIYEVDTPPPFKKLTIDSIYEFDHAIRFSADPLVAAKIIEFLENDTEVGKLEDLTQTWTHAYRLTVSRLANLQDTADWLVSKFGK